MSKKILYHCVDCNHYMECACGYENEHACNDCATLRPMMKVIGNKQPTRSPATTITIDLLKRHNRIFFEAASFHGDKEYKIIHKDGRNFLRVNTRLTGWVTYEIGAPGHSTYELTYSRLTV